MKKINWASILSWLIIFTVGVEDSSYGQSCTRNSYAVSGDSLIQGSCTINGDLIILKGGVLNVDLTGSAIDTFIVRGNVVLQSNAVLWIHADSGSTGELFIVSNTLSSPRTISENGTSIIRLENIEFRTQEGDLTSKGSLTMNCNSSDSSKLLVTNTFLDYSKAWMLNNLNRQATLIATNTNNLPTEVYVYDSTSVAVQENSNIQIWLNFDSTYTLNLPLITSKYNWQAGKGHGGLATHWLLGVNNAMPSLGIIVQPTAKLIVNGHGTPASGELKTDLYFANNKDTLKGLKAGVIQNTTIDNRLTFNNVQLGPFAWSIYLLTHDTLYIKNSTINEIGIFGPGEVVVDSSVLQLADLASIGVGSNMIINNSEIWNKVILAENRSNITLNSCSITGSLVDAGDTGSVISINNGCLYPNPPGCTPTNLVNFSNGLPNCNPTIPPGMPSLMGNVVINGSCLATAVGEIASVNYNFAISPNPFSTQTTLSLNLTTPAVVKLTLYNAIGQRISSVEDRYLLSGNYMYQVSAPERGVYFLRTLVDGVTETRKIIQVE